MGLFKTCKVLREIVMTNPSARPPGHEPQITPTVTLLPNQNGGGASTAKSAKKTAVSIPGNQKDSEELCLLSLLFQQEEVFILRTAIATAIVMVGLRLLRLNEFSRLLCNPLLHVVVPVALMYGSSRFNQRRLGQIGFLWVVGVSPVCMVVLAF